MTFSADITRFVEKAKGNVDKAVRQTVVLAAQGVILGSPVDTGRFRANWNFSPDSPNLAHAEHFDPSGAATLARIQSQVAEMKAGGVAYLANGLPYGPRLEMGYSKQAPQGFVRLTMMDLPRRIEAYAATLK